MLSRALNKPMKSIINAPHLQKYLYPKNPFISKFISFNLTDSSTNFILRKSTRKFNKGDWYDSERLKPLQFF